MIFDVRNDISLTVKASRTFAIFVISHLPMPYYPFVISEFITCFADSAVILFFFVSGYYFRSTKDGDFFDYFCRRLKSIIVPWVSMGTMVYLLTYVNGQGNLSFSGWFNWIIGNRTYLYYMTVLVLCYAVFYTIVDNTPMLILMVLINITSLALSFFGMLDGVKASLGINDFLVFTNWVAPFALGCLFRKYKVLEKMLSFSYTPTLLLTLYIFFTYVLCRFDSFSLVFFSPTGMARRFGVALFILTISYFLRNSRGLLAISKYTFSIYLTHFSAIQLINAVVRRSNLTSTIFSYLMPVLVVAVTVALLFLGDVFSGKIGLKKWYRMMWVLENENLICCE